MSKQSERVKRWRKATKSRIVEAMGGGCACCGYNKCYASLALHHLEPKQKDFSLGAIRASPKSWEAIIKEVKKCILVCHNCHGEIHEGIREIPHKYHVFNEKFEDYNSLIKSNFILIQCPVCNKSMPEKNKYCSAKCSGKARSKINWNNINLFEEIKSKSIVQIAKELGCSDVAVHKRLKKIKIKN